jgi:DNA-binding MarR family transcriptional regulator
MKNKPTQEQIDLWRDFISCHANLVGHLEQELKKAGAISPLWYDVLVILWHQPQKRMRLSELADAAILSRYTVSRVVDRLQKENYIRRESCPNDGRCAYAVLTDAGIEAMRKAWRPYRRVLSETFFSQLTDAEQKQMSGILGKLNLVNGIE